MAEHIDILMDDGLQFGLGAFETIALRDGKAEFLEYHIERLHAALDFLGIDRRPKPEDVHEFLDTNAQKNGGLPPLHAMKIIASERNTIMDFRENPYSAQRIAKGFRVDLSPVLRNETSPFAYHKTLNYGDNILAKRHAVKSGLDEYLFLNSRGEICEGSTTNVFFVIEGELITPERNCGLLPGVMRRVVLENTNVRECIITPSDLHGLSECFLTNSLMGVMPIKNLAGTELEVGPVTHQIMNIIEDVRGR